MVRASPATDHDIRRGSANVSTLGDTYPTRTRPGRSQRG
jgi:hypothetical protein